jgi:hypothetical protein
MASKETIEDEVAQRWAELISNYLQRIPTKDRPQRLRMFKRAIELVERRWGALSF